MVAGFDTARMVLQDGGHFDEDTETMLRRWGDSSTTLQPDAIQWSVECFGTNSSAERWSAGNP